MFLAALFQFLESLIEQCQHKYRNRMKHPTLLAADKYWSAILTKSMSRLSHSTRVGAAQARDSIEMGKKIQLLL